MRAVDEGNLPHAFFSPSSRPSYEAPVKGILLRKEVLILSFDF